LGSSANALLFRWSGVVPGFAVDFIGIGAEKAATYWIAGCLREHPEVSFARRKELAFFNDYDQHLLKVRTRQYERGMGWYERQFPPCLPGQIRGEYTPTYMYSPLAARRIHRHFPDAKLIVCLRDPVKRAFSQYIHDKRIGMIGNVSFEQALSRHDSYVEKGLYYKHLSDYTALFPRENTLILLVDDIKDDRKAVLRRLYGFLGLKYVGYLPPSLDAQPNAASEARFPWLNYLLIHGEYLLGRMRLFPVLYLMQDIGFRRATFLFSYTTNSKPLAAYPKMSEETEARLRNTFRQDVTQLEGLIDRDLSGWKA
jgi:hypothetical protein